MKWVGYFLFFTGLAGASKMRTNRVLSITSNGEQVTLTNEITHKRWKLNDALCLFKSNKELACGFVGRLTESSLIIKIESRNYKIFPGDDVELRIESK